MKLPEIRARFGPDGITEFAPVYGRLGAITDDTQMTLFTGKWSVSIPPDGEAEIHTLS